MTQWLLANRRADYDEIKIVFANTGQEHEETLEFVKRCDRHFGLGVQWVEGVVHPELGTGTTHKLVDFGTANRKGAPFEDMIAKYGLPNVTFPHCTRELKMNPMRSYMRALGWERYDTAIGIRIDEIDRLNPNYKALGIIYPLAFDCPMTKPDVNRFWRAMPFRLELKGYEGNCKWCWKKAIRKHLTIMQDDPAAFDFPERMERDYANVGPKDTGAEYPRRFFRQKLTVADLRLLAAKPFERAVDDAVIYREKNMFGIDLDKAAGCSESCEVFHDEPVHQ